MERKKVWLMDIKDKVKISKTRCCPPHYFPHKFPLGKKICKEECHIHKAKWRMAHHILFCKYLKCPNYEFMMSKYRVRK